MGIWFFLQQNVRKCCPIPVDNDDYTASPPVWEYDGLISFQFQRLSCEAVEVHITHSNTTSVGAPIMDALLCNAEDICIFRQL